MKNTIYILFSIILSLGLNSCELRDELKNDLDNINQGEGVMSLNLSSKAGDAVEVQVRRDFPDEDIDINNYTIKILDVETESVKKESSYRELVEEGGKVKLTVGRYRVVAYNYDGSAVTASERPFFLGQTEFQIIAGKTTTVHTTCRLQNVKVGLSLTENFENLFKDDYTITITNGASGVYIYTKANISKKVYFNVPENANSIQMSLKATSKENAEVSESYTITKPINADNNTILEKGDYFRIILNAGAPPIIDPVTKIELDISVDLTMIETGVTIEIPTENIVYNPKPTDDNKGPIVVTGLNATYNIINSESPIIPTVQVDLSVPNGIQKLLVKIESNNEGFMSVLTNLGLNTEFDIANPGDLLGVLSNSLSSGEGIGLIDANDPIKEKTKFLFDITDFMALLKNFGLNESSFSITVTDGVNEDVTGKLLVNIIEETI